MFVDDFVELRSVVVLPSVNVISPPRFSGPPATARPKKEKTVNIQIHLSFCVRNLRTQITCLVFCTPTPHHLEHRTKKNIFHPHAVASSAKKKTQEPLLYVQECHPLLSPSVRSAELHPELLPSSSDALQNPLLMRGVQLNSVISHEACGRTKTLCLRLESPFQEFR